jgi:phosphoglycerate dehydrogenase-like enzyme
MPGLLILAKQAQEYRRLIEAAGLPPLEVTAVTEPDELAGDAPGCEIVFGEARLIREMLPRLPRLRWVQTTSAGVEPLLEPGLRRDYLLTNAFDVFGDSMCEYVFAYLLAHERRLFDRLRSQQTRHWDHSPGGRLRGRTLGLLGVGSIGAELARSAKHFGMQVRGYTRSSESSRAVDAYYHGDRVLEFARGLDYLVCVVPNTAATRRIVDAALLQALPPGAVLINLGRGAALDETALLQALQSGRLALAVLDVFEHEPLPPEHPFWQTPNLLMTFHTSALHEPHDMIRPFLENYARFTRGETLLHQVDFERGY